MVIIKGITAVNGAVVQAATKLVALAARVASVILIVPLLEELVHNKAACGTVQVTLLLAFWPEAIVVQPISAVCASTKTLL